MVEIPVPFNVIARGGLDIARFGEAREALRKRLGRHESFQRTPEAPLSDRYPDIGLFLDFDKTDSLNFIEATLPAEVFYESVSLLAQDYHEVVAELSARGIHGAEDDSGIEYTELGLALYNPSPEEFDSVVEGVTIFAPGYYG